MLVACRVTTGHEDEAALKVWVLALEGVKQLHPGSALEAEVGQDDVVRMVDGEERERFFYADAGHDLGRVFQTALEGSDHEPLVVDDEDAEFSRGGPHSRNG